MNIIIAILILGIVIAFHEFGHFIIAKSRGITVREFSIGMGPKLFGFEKGGTQYCLRLLPIGGACVMGEDEAVGPEDVNAFNNKTVWERIAVVFAGPFFNFVLAFLLSIIICHYCVLESGDRFDCSRTWQLHYCRIGKRSISN